ncbi:alpha-amylase [Bacillus sp. RG28]|uniref:Alpha-amylase n=1 Tax=Gottfriedia endophytica TaxID=2820819 RepID=A0A940NHU0_9BACI|nr:alpha-amylase family glycosyl hydrolase [Gottfriedia endophytica]MBP0724570.1 alpha-amylase [Gottfriedia endophytica]
MKKLNCFLLIFALVFSLFPKQSNAATNDQNDSSQMIYRIMVDRFFDGDPTNDQNSKPLDPNGFHGGDIQGIIKKLDYIKGYGYTMISLTPIQQNDENGYHGFWITDFNKMDKRFGNLNDLKKLVKEAHKRNIKVMLDFVTNNTSSKSPWLEDPAKKNWFHEKSSTNNKENQWVNSLPDLNQDNPAVANYLINSAKWWMNETKIDGYRLDHADYVPVSFWKKFVSDIKSVNSSFILMADVKDTSDQTIKEFKNAGFDAVSDTALFTDLTNSFLTKGVSIAQLVKHQSVLDQTNIPLVNYLDDETTKRFVNNVNQKYEYPPSRLKLALVYQYTTPGIPMNLYGTEIAMNGGEIPDNLKDMDFRTDDKFSDYITKLIELRKTLPSLTKGSFQLIYDKQGLSVIERTYKNETTYTVINNTAKDQTVHLSFNKISKKNELRGLLADDLVRANSNGFDIVIKRESANIYAVAPKTGVRYGVIAILIFIFVGFFMFIAFAKKRQKQANN